VSFHSGINLNGIAAETYNPLMDALDSQSVAGSASAERPAIVRETVLDNGLRVLIQEVHTAPLASVWCWYHVGSKDEGPGITGISHWVEHMNFKGTANISSSTAVTGTATPG
jgi:predicted Zn-dependent peptidase